jgi:hypothetical protein
MPSIVSFLKMHNMHWEIVKPLNYLFTKILTLLWLSGTDNEDDSTFSGCVLSEGISVGKEKTSGGSYGIGKNAIFWVFEIENCFLFFF